ncbi:hypothetical protein HZY97_12075 [Sphingomonas sp. R-74633]|uniref:hypothetical protein n=1 Tax=Sphingomonas sp. R-74633 TaxID=2751188 RepID=UPI0015D1BA79|nr:hypothetical protein [Sphingomonas sp. R-74633]NYT41499.1 hypothetical protein [Sphingomonas sp. R-74633]
MRMLRIAGALALASMALSGCYGDRPGYNGDRHHRGDHHRGDHNGGDHDHHDH